MYKKVQEVQYTVNCRKKEETDEYEQWKFFFSTVCMYCTTKGSQNIKDYSNKKTQIFRSPMHIFQTHLYQM
jgi:hypothetical protein